MDTRGQRLLTPAWDSITPACVWECTDVEGKPFIQRSPGPAGRQAGIRVNWGGMHSPGTSTHYMHEGCETPPARSHARAQTRKHRRTPLCSPRINQTFSDDGRPSVAVCGWGLFGRWSQKSNGIVFMQEIKKPPFCTVMEMRGAGKGRDGGWINKTAINHFLFAFVN